ncbi:hypothetical protein ACJZ2D_005561 [Fusarium nematophilum]
MDITLSLPSCSLHWKRVRRTRVQAAVSRKESNGRTPLIWASMWGHLECVKLLIKHGSLVDARDDMGGTPLSWAATYSRSDVMKLLIRVGAMVDETLLGWPRITISCLKLMTYLCDHEMNTALHLAAEWNHLAMVQWLVETAKLRIDRVNRFKHSVLDCATYCCAEDVIKYLVKKRERMNTRTSCKTEVANNAIAFVLATLWRCSPWGHPIAMVHVVSKKSRIVDPKTGKEINPTSLTSTRKITKGFDGQTRVMGAMTAMFEPRHTKSTSTRQANRPGHAPGIGNQHPLLQHQQSQDSHQGRLAGEGA